MCAQWVTGASGIQCLNKEACDPHFLSEAGGFSLHSFATIDKMSLLFIYFNLPIGVMLCLIFSPSV